MKKNFITRKACSSVLVASLLATLAIPSWASSAVPNLNHVFVIVGENTELSQIITPNSPAPYIVNTLIPDVRYQETAFLTNYFATTHYSEANYAAMTSGQYTGDEQLDLALATTHQNIDNIFHQLGEAGRSYTSWVESMPAPCYLVSAGKNQNLNSYGFDHNPQLIFDNVEGGMTLLDADGSNEWTNTGNQGGVYCQSNNVSASNNPSSQNDMSAFNNALLGLGSHPITDFNLIIPNECESGANNCSPSGNSITQFDTFLSKEVPLIQSYINAHGGLLIILFDEGITNSPKRADRYGDGGNVVFLAWGPQVHQGTYATQYTHYSFLRTLQDGFGLGTVYGYLGGAGQAASITDIWK